MRKSSTFLAARIVTLAFDAPLQAAELPLWEKESPDQPIDHEVKEQVRSHQAQAAATLPDKQPVAFNYGNSSNIGSGMPSGSGSSSTSASSPMSDWPEVSSETIGPGSIHWPSASSAMVPRSRSRFSRCTS